MAYQALYRKFRPTTFHHVIGQDHIVRTLKNQIATSRVSHAYLFCGTRGTGKTSTAKIFARAINCENSSTGEPCNTCPMCLAISEGRSLNVVEIDAASNNGVDNIREIREEVKYPPTEGKYKVYIIDEVHMLSMGAFNALLKTLEEPPAHVIFILATTDPQKVPITILSRCQRFDFRRISSEEIAETLRIYTNEEHVKIDDRALSYIARLADGSMRDSLSILDQCIAFYYQEEITLEKVLEVTGSVDNTVFFQMTDALIDTDSSGVLQIIEEINMQGREMGQFASDLTVHLRNLLVSKTIEDPSSVLDLSAETISRLKAQCERISKAEIVHLIRVLSALTSELRYAANERIVLEVALLKLCSPEVWENIDGLVARMNVFEKALKKGITITPALKTETTTAPPIVKEKPKAAPEDIQEAIKLWPSIKKNFDSVTKNLLSPVSLKYRDGDFAELICPDGAVEDILKKKLPEIQEKLFEKIGKKFELRITKESEYHAWEVEIYGDPEEHVSDQEFESLMHSYLPEADIE